jgi:hypothetical protein
VADAIEESGVPTQLRRWLAEGQESVRARDRAVLSPSGDGAAAHSTNGRETRLVEGSIA